VGGGGGPLARPWRARRGGASYGDGGEPVRGGLRELEQGQALEPGRVRRRGGGRRPLAETDPTLVEDLERLVDPDSRGDPGQPLRWTAKSVRKLAGALRDAGHRVSHETVARLLRSLGYSLQANAKTREGAEHPDRDEQFRHISRAASQAIEAGQPVISVDTKKKELIGDFKAVGAELRPQGSPIPVRVHDFKDTELGKAIPYGVYDLASDSGWVSVGVDHDTRRLRGRVDPLVVGAPRASALPARHDADDHRRLRSRDRAAGRGLPLPPGTSKWNQIEHRLFSFITQNWRGKPLLSREVIVNLIGATTTRTGLEVYARLDEREYPKGIAVSDAELAAVRLQDHEFHPEWNYTSSRKLIADEH